MEIKPLISIAMCTFNGEQYLNEQISSIINQDYGNIELVVVDDCSFDSTWSLLEAWQTKYPSIVKIHKNTVNLGFNKNFEKAICLSQGDYIAIADQDDVWLFNKLSKLMDCFKDPEVMLAHGAEATIIKDIIKEGSDSKIDKKLFRGSDTRTILFHNQIPGHCILFSKKLINDIVPIPANMFYDWWILVLATCRGKVGIVSDIVMYHRIHDNNAYFKLGERYKDDHGELVLNSLRIFKKIDNMNFRTKSFIDKSIFILDRHFKKSKGKFDLKMFLYLMYWYNVIFDVFNRKSYVHKQAAKIKAVYTYSKW